LIKCEAEDAGLSSHLDFATPIITPFPDVFGRFHGSGPVE
jgi:hypothetical protein